MFASTFLTNVDGPPIGSLVTVMRKSLSPSPLVFVGASQRTNAFPFPGAPSKFCGGLGTVLTSVVSESVLLARVGSNTGDETSTPRLADKGPGGASGEGERRTLTEMQYVTVCPAAILVSVIFSPGSSSMLGVGQVPPLFTE